MIADARRAPRVLVRVLGPCVLTVGDDELDLSQVQRRIVARLALAGRRGVTTSALIEAVWDDDAPPTARAAVQNQISRIRAAAEGVVGLITTVVDRYVLSAETDADLFTAAVRLAEDAMLRGDADVAGALGEQAVSWWRGEPYPELGGIADGVRRSYATARSTAENLRVESALLTGRTGWALQQAEILVAEAPYDEHRATILGRALEASGRRGDALAAIAEARRRLRADLGMDGGRELRAAEAAILETDAAAPPEAMRNGPFVGRRREVRAILGAATRGRSVIVTGEPGIGLSRLLGHVRGELASLGGAAVALVRCPAHPATAVSVLADLLDELALTFPPGLGTMGGFVPAVAGAAATRPVVLLVDDVHLAGPSSRAALSAVAAIDGVAVVAAGHEIDWRPAGDEPEAVEVRGLEPAAIAELLRSHGDRRARAEPVVVSRLHRLSGGNPFFLGELLQGAGWEIALEAEPAEQPVPSRLDGMVRARLAQLRPPERRVLEVCAVAGEGTPRDVVAVVAGERGIVGAVESGLLDDLPGAGMRVRHGVVEQIVYRGIPTGRRAELHHAIGTALAAAQASPAIIAHHLLAAPAIDPAAVVAAASAAASGASALGAHRDAADWLRRALAAADAVDDPAAGLRLRIELGDALRLAGDPAHVDLLVEAAEEAERTGEPDLLGAAAYALLQLGGATVSTDVDDRIERISRRALEVIADPHLAAAVAGASSLALSMTGDAARSRALFMEAERAATTPEARRAVLPFAYLALGLPDDLGRRRELAEELVRRSTDADDPVGVFEGLHLRFSSQLQSADGAGLRATQEAMERLVDRVGDVGRRWALHYQSASIAHLDDDLASAERRAEEAFGLFGPVSPSRAIAVYQAQLLPLRIVDERLDELEPVLATMIEQQPGVPAWHAAYALVLARGRPSEAAEHARLALEREERDFTWLAAHVVGGRAAALAGDADVGARYADRLVPWSGLACWQGTCSYGPVDTTLALLARARGDRAATERYARSARVTAGQLRAPVFVRDLQQLGL